MTPKVDKEALRKVFLRSRNQSALTQSNTVHTKIQQKLVDFISSRNVQHIGLYHAFRGEIDVFPIVDMLPKHSFYLPRVSGRDLEFARVNVDEILVAGSFGILEPSGDCVDKHLLDLMVVPGIAFTNDGKRLGYGGGFYDRFLDGLETKIACVGVCADLLLVDMLPVEAHDKEMDFVVTETQIYESSVEKI